jgi:hypothetical protein
MKRESGLSCLGCKRPWVRIPPSRLLESTVYGHQTVPVFIVLHTELHIQSEKNFRISYTALVSATVIGSFQQQSQWITTDSFWLFKNNEQARICLAFLLYISLPAIINPARNGRSAF